MCTCNECGVELVRGDNWYTTLTTRICKACHLERNRRWRKERSEEDKAIARKRQNKYRRESNRSDPIPNLFEGAKARAKRGNIPFNITRDDIVLPEYCPILGLKLKVNQGKVCDSSYSLDRIIPELGYVQGNVQVISKLANQIKSNATTDQIGLVYFYMKQLEEESNNE